MARVLGIGGVFYKVPDPRSVQDWYAKVLGFDLNDWGGASFEPGAPSQQWSLFAADSDYFAPSTQGFMLNLMVDDIDGVLARAAEAGVAPLGRQDESYGRFAWLLDPAGVKIELWQSVEDAQ
jgi:predicted enzyme related to lactoylglutathione lyase